MRGRKNSIKKLKVWRFDFQVENFAPKLALFGLISSFKTKSERYGNNIGFEPFRATLMERSLKMHSLRHP